MLEVIRVSKTYSLGRIRALDNVSLSAGAQEVLGLLGPNGAGKTTLIKIVAGLVAPSAGHVTLAGFNVQRQRYQALKHLGVVLEGARNLYWRLTVRDNLLYFGQIKGMPARLIARRMPDLLSLLQIEGLADRTVDSLSAGQKQRCAIAVAMVHEPQVLILDEPTNGLDLPSVDNLIEVLHALRSQRRMTILVSSHHMSFVQEVVDSVAFIDKGKLVGVLSASEVKSFSQREHYVLSLEGDEPLTPARVESLWPGMAAHFDPAHNTLSIEVKPSESLSTYLTVLLRAGIRVRSVERVDHNLESVYRQLLGSERKGKPDDA